MIIMSFNTQHCLNYLERRIDYEIMAKAILDCGADIVGLQEMFNGGKFEEQTRILAELCGFKYYYFAKAIDDVDGPYGNAILSKIPLKSVETIIISDPPRTRKNGYYETRCVLKAVLENGLCVLVTHFGLVPEEQENALATVFELIEDKNCVLLGDFNLEPTSPIIRKISEKMLDTATLFDKPLLSFPSDKPTIKIDYIFTSHDLCVKRADIPEIISADHRPHIAEIN